MSCKALPRPGPLVPCAWFSEVAGHSFADCAVSNGRSLLAFFFLAGEKLIMKVSTEFPNQ